MTTTYYSGLWIDTPEGTAEFDRITDALCDLDRKIEETKDDLEKQFGGGAPKANDNSGYARAYRDRERQIEILKRDRTRMEGYLDEISKRVA
jgi:hypothetical protein